jgi:hypothetical protein
MAEDIAKTNEGDLLPFGLGKLGTGEYLELGELRIPRYGSLTVAEHIEIAKIDVTAAGAKYNSDCLTILVKSRCKDIGAFDLKHVPTHLLKAGIDFFYNELREWKDAKTGEVDEEAIKKLTGLKSSGGSELASQTMADSSQSDSESNPSGSSAKPSKRSRKMS